MSNLVITLGGVQLPDQSDLVEVTTPNDADIRTEDGTLYTDFVSVLRSWEISWIRLSKTDYDAIRQVFMDQYENESYPLLQIPLYSISSPVKVNMSRKNIRFDGNCVEGFGITLQEQYAIS